MPGPTRSPALWKASVQRTGGGGSSDGVNSCLGKLGTQHCPLVVPSRTTLELLLSSTHPVLRMADPPFFLHSSLPLPFFQIISTWWLRQQKRGRGPTVRCNHCWRDHIGCRDGGNPGGCPMPFVLSAPRNDLETDMDRSLPQMWNAQYKAVHNGCCQNGEWGKRYILF